MTSTQMFGARASSMLKASGSVAVAPPGLVTTTDQRPRALPARSKVAVRVVPSFVMFGEVPTMSV